MWNCVHFLGENVAQSILEAGGISSIVPLQWEPLRVLLQLILGD